VSEPETITEDELAEALDSFWLFVACDGQRVHGQVADPGEVASVLLATLGRIAAGRSPSGTARPPLPVAERAVDAALAADSEWMHKARQVVFVSPSRDQVRAMLEAAGPVIREGDRDRLAAILDAMADSAQQAASGYPAGSAARAELQGRGGAYAEAASVVRSGEAPRGEGGAP
jgi:hypothetical protein